MKCELVRDQIVLLHYGELPDELAGPLEMHLAECAGCRGEWESLAVFEEHLALMPMVEPTPNLLAQSRMMLDDALDTEPAYGFLSRLRVNFFSWVGHMQSAPALATLLLGVGFLGGNFTYRYQVAHAPKPAGSGGVLVMTHPANSIVGNVTGVERIPDSELVQVHYNRVVPETMEGSLDSPEIRDVLLQGSSPAMQRVMTTTAVRGDAVSMLARECKAGHGCASEADGKGLLNALMVSLRYDHDAGVRMAALEGLQLFVGKDLRVRDAVAEALAHDESAEVRTAAVSVLRPVQSDSSVRRVLRTASVQDENPYIRTASFDALQGAADIQ